MGNQMIKSTIYKFRLFLKLNIIYWMVLFAIATLVRLVSPSILHATSYRIFLLSTIIFWFVILILFIIYFYKTLKVLNQGAKLKVNPILFLLFTIVSVPFFVITIIILIIIWTKTNSYLKELQ